jgi:serine/threonine-protein kinase
LGNGSSEGDVLEDRYRLVRILGQGAAGTVWLAHDTTRGIDVAVKILRATLAKNRRMMKRFNREAELGERMMSPHIVKVLARGATPQDLPYTVYEHLDGADLRTHLTTNGRLGYGDLQLVVVHACRALARAHAVGVIHQDVKPDNLFVTSDVEGRPLVKVLDFGVAQRAVSLVDGDRPLVGTLEYIAPEVLLAEREPNARSDLYGLGVVAYECVTGRVPYPASNVGQLVLVVSKGERTPVKSRRPDAPRELDAWFDRVLARDPEARFATAKETSDALVQALRDVATNQPSVLRGGKKPQTTSGSYRLIREEPGDDADD